MKYLLHLAILSMLTIGHSLADGEEGKVESKHKLAADFETCPDGHKALKDVPIIWGHFEFFTKNPKDYTNKERELSARRDQGEIVFGGDIIPPNPPRFKVACGRCGFAFQPSDITDEERKTLKVAPDYGSYWSRNSRDAAGFRIPFNKQLLSFPQMKAASGSIDFSQTLSGDGKNLESESIMFHSQLLIDQILETVRKWLKENGRNPDHLKRVENAFAHHTYNYSEEGIWVLLRDDDHFESGKTLVSVTLEPRDANKTRLDNPLPQPKSN